MAHGDKSESIRKHAWLKLIEPKIRRGARQVTVEIDPLMSEMEAQGFPGNHPRQFCTALRKQSFLREKGLHLDRVERSPSSKGDDGRHVVLHFSVDANLRSSAGSNQSESAATRETAHQRAVRLTEKLRGILKDELAEYGGGEAFLDWIRSEDDEAA